MGNIKIKRLSKRIKEIVSSIVLFDLQDPRIDLVTFTKVKLSNDLSHAIVFYSAMGDEAHLRTVQRALDHSRGHIQSQLASRLHTRQTPHLKFEYDQSVAKAIEMEAILSELREEWEDPEAEGEEE